MSQNRSVFHQKIGLTRKKYQKGINDLYIWTSILLNSMDYILKDETFFKNENFNMPSPRKNGKSLNRDVEQLKDIITSAREINLIKSNFVYLIAQYESFLQEIMHHIFYYRAIINPSKIEKAIIDFTFLSPYKQFEYLEIFLGVNAHKKDIKTQILEAKATRDLFVHNDGAINHRYVNKSGSLQRGKIGENISCDFRYFTESLSAIKSSMGQISSSLQRELAYNYTSKPIEEWTVAKELIKYAN
jgi:hypothetical protein